MRAGAADGVDAIVEPRQQYRSAVDMAGKHASLGHAGERDALAKIRAGRR
jgi:hypothetical protein